MGTRAARWSDRRRTRWALAVAMVLLSVVQTGVVLVHANDKATPLAVEDAVEQFRSTQAPATTAPATTSEATAPTTAVPGAAPPAPDGSPDAGGAPVGASAPTAPAAPATQPAPTTTAPGDGPALPEPGVYTYRTEGYEEVDALGGRRHDYPSETTITYTHAECGVRERWAPLEQRYDDRLLCPGPDGDQAHWFESQRSFFGQVDTRLLRCDPGSLARPVPAAPGMRWSFRCRDEETVADSQATVVAVGPHEVAGQTVPAVQLQIRTDVTGDSAASSTIDVWVHERTGLVLRRVSVLDGQSPGPSGDVSYRERYTLELSSLTPRR